MHYRFVSRDRFAEGIAREQYIEHAETHSNYYGTHKESIRELAQQGKVCVLEIDVKGAQQIKEQHAELQCNFVFVTCPDALDTLAQRLSARGTESKEQIQTRLNTAKAELDFLDNTDVSTR